jgi:CrcB protein
MAMNPPSLSVASLYVALGGGLGAWLRYITGRLWTAAIGPVAASGFPWATLTVNVLGSFAMGLLAGWLAHFGSPQTPLVTQGLGTEGWRLLLGVGVLGGYTTFSSFSLEIALMAQRGQLMQAGLYITVSLVAGVVGLFAGLAIMRSLA